MPDVEGKCEPYSINKNIGTSIDPKNLITLLSCKNDKSDDVYQIGHVIVGIGEKQYATFYERKVSVEKSLNTFDSFTEVKLKK